MPATSAPRLFASLAALVLPLASFAGAQEFRIETDVYVGEEPESVSHTVTLFERSAVYEFVDKPEQIIVYRPASEGHAAQFILLDVATERRTDVEAARVDRLIEKLSSWAADQKNALLKFSASPQFDESFDAESGNLTLANSEWTYQAATVPAEDPSALERYREFTDRYAKLNTMLQNTPPPGPRLALNAALARHRVIPVEIRRTLGGDEKNQVRAAHLFSWRLSREDRIRIDDAQAALANFEKVDNKKFLAARAEKEVVRGQSR
jgi:hypothetical protein